MNKVCVFLLVSCIMTVNPLLAQHKGKDGYQASSTYKRKKRTKNFKHKPKEKTYSYILKESTEGILYGNPCAIEETHRMGFEYVVQKSSLPGGMEMEDVRWHNFWVKVKLVVTRSPFWKLILKKRIRDCRYKSGDIVG